MSISAIDRRQWNNCTSPKIVPAHLTDCELLLCCIFYYTSDTDYNDILEDTVGTTQGSSHSVTLPIDHITSSLRDLTLPTAAAYHGPRYDSLYLMSSISTIMDLAITELLAAAQYNSNSVNGIMVGSYKSLVVVVVRSLTTREHSLTNHGDQLTFLVVS